MRMLLFALILGLCCLIPIHAQVESQDSLALVALYNNTNGPGWTNKTNWLTGPVMSWYGVYVSNGRVVGLKLPSNQLNGTIPVELGNLSALYFIDLSSNKLEGQIPETFWNLTKLASLDLSVNQLSGQISNQLGNLKVLETLYLYFNKLTGQIPKELGNLTKLIDLGLFRNQLSGQIPQQIGNLANLRSLGLNNNQLSGTIPPEIGNLTNLKGLNLYNNELTGSIPGEIGNLSNLTQLSLDYNQLTGPISGEICNLTQLIGLGLSFNQLSGQIPQQIGNLANLQSLNLRNDQLSGSIPSQLFNMGNLLYLDLGKNKLGGQIPEEIGQLKKIRGIALDSIQLNGKIPEQIGNLTELQELQLQNNRLEGQIPIQIGNLTKLRLLYLQYNQLSGEIPVQIGDPPLDNINLNNNKFTSLPKLPATVHGVVVGSLQSNQLTFDDLIPNIFHFPDYAPQNTVGSPRTKTVLVGATDTIQLGFDNSITNSIYYWQKNGSYIAQKGTNYLTIVNASVSDTGLYICSISNPQAYKLTLTTAPIRVMIKDAINESDSLALVALYNSTNGSGWTTKTNWLTGPVRTWAGVTVNEGRVTELMFMNNNLTGTLPPEIGNLEKLTKIWIDSSPLSGSIPVTIGNLHNLESITIIKTQLSGIIPDTIGSLLNLKSITLEGNNLTGSIPPISNLKNLTNLSLNANGLTGTIPEEIYGLTNLTYIDFAGNLLEGSLSSSIGNLKKLQYLSVYSNRLSGVIPESFNQLVNLTNLNLSYNQFTGDILTYFSNLKQLQQLDLTGNMFFGTIPNELANLSSLSLLRLDRNQFTGAPPASPYWTYFSFSNNKLKGLIPASLSRTLSSANASNNSFSFCDLIEFVKNKKAECNITYAPQSTIGIPYYSTVIQGASYTIDLHIDSAITTSTYKWYKNGQLYNTTSVNKLIFPSTTIADNGIYTCSITNSEAVSLTLTTAPITLIVKDGANPSDSLALVALYNSTNGPGWTNKTNWLTGPVRSWYGVSVSNGRVTHLSLRGNNLVGPLPKEIGNLDKLTEIRLSGNQLSGQIPFEFETLTSLLVIDLEYNQLNGSVAMQFGSLTNLIVLDLGSNKLTGQIPSQLGNLHNLTTILLNDNQISGSIPSELGNLAKLTTLNLSTNKISGEIPLQLFTLTALQILNLEENQLTGQLPVQLSNLKSLQTLRLDINQLTGQIPAELCNLTSLEFLYLQNNQFTGSIPAGIGKLTELTFLFLNNNLLSGSIPTEIGNLIKLNYLSLANNQLSGQIPIQLGNLTKLGGLYLQNNQLSGPIPVQLSNLTYLGLLYLNNNKFTSLPLLPTTMPKVASVQSNQLTFDDIIPNISYIPDYAPQNIIGSPRTKIMLVGATDTIQLDFDNNITTSIYKWYKNGSLITQKGTNYLTIVNASVSDTGLYTCSISNAQAYKLTLTTAPIRLIIKDVINESDSLALVALYNSTNGSGWTNKTNWLTGPVKTWAGISVTKNRVTEVNLSGKGLEGTLPASIINLTALTAFNLSNNRLTGIIPAGITSISGLHLAVDSNRYTFEHLLPAHNSVATGVVMTYAAQDSVGQNGLHTVEEGKSDSIMLDIDNNLTNNVYEWYKKGVKVYTGNVNKYLIKQASISDTGVYNCIVTNPAMTNLKLQSRKVRIVLQKPYFEIQPVAVPLCASNQAMFTVKALPVMATYRWQKYASNQWVDLMENQNEAGTLSDTFLIRKVIHFYDGMEFRCIAKSAGGEAISDIIALSVDTIERTITPAYSLLCKGSSFTAHCIADAKYVLSYKWLLKTKSGNSWNEITDNTNVTGSGTPTINLLTVNEDHDSSLFKCVVYNSVCSVNTDSVLLGIKTLNIDREPANVTACLNDKVVYTIKATGTVNITYHWQIQLSGGWYDIVDYGILGANKDTLVVPKAIAALNGAAFKCVVNNGACNITSAPATLTIPLTIDSQPSDVIVCNSSDASFSVLALGINPIQYQWQWLDGTVWRNLVNNTLYSGVTTHSLKGHNFTLVNTNTWYRCYIRNATCIAISDSVKLTVNAYPPKPFIYQLGNTLKTVTSEYVQWYYNGNAVEDTHSNPRSLLNDGSYAASVSEKGCMSLKSETINYSNDVGKAYKVRFSLDSVYLINSGLAVNSTECMQITHGFLSGNNNGNAAYDRIEKCGGMNAKQWYTLPNNGNVLDKYFTTSTDDYTIHYTKNHDSTNLLTYSSPVNLFDFEPFKSLKQTVVRNNGTNQDSISYTLRWELPGYPSTPTLLVTGDRNGSMCEGEKVTLSIPGIPDFDYHFIWEYDWDRANQGSWDNSVAEGYKLIDNTIHGEKNIEFTVPQPPADSVKIWIRARYKIGGAIVPGTGKVFKVMRWNHFNAIATSPIKHPDHPYNITCYNGFDGLINITATGGTPNYTFHLENSNKFKLDGMVNANSTKGLDSLKAAQYTWKVSDHRGCHISGTIALTQPDSIRRILTVTNVTPCGGDSTGGIKVDVNDPTGRYSFAIDTLDSENTNGIFEHLIAGEYFMNIAKTYVATTTDTINCLVAIGPIVITEPPPIEFNPKDVEILTTRQRCHGYDVDVRIYAGGGIPPLIYRIDGMDVRDNIVDDGISSLRIKPGAHIIDIFDLHGCTLRDTFKVADVPPIRIDSVQITNDFGCNRNGEITLNIYGRDPATDILRDDTNPGFLYAYINQLSPNKFKYYGVQAGLYKLSIYSDGCKSDTTVVVGSTVNPNLAEMFKFKLDTIFPTCGNANGGIHIEPDPLMTTQYFGQPGQNTYYLYKDMKFENRTFIGTTRSGTHHLEWIGTPGLDTPPETVVIDTLQPGKYLLKIYLNSDYLNSSNCVLLDTIVLSDIDAPKIGIRKTDPSCWKFGDGKITLSGGGSGLNITLNGKTIGGNESFINLRSGIYEVQIDSGKLCRTYQYAKLIDPPKLIINSLTHNDVLCYGDSTGNITYTASGGVGTYNYFVVAKDTIRLASGNANNLAPDLYFTYVKDANFCKAHDSIEVLEPLKVTYEIDSVINQVCSSAPVGRFDIKAYGGVPPYQYSPNHGNSWLATSRITGLMPSLYPVLVKDANNCWSDLEDTVEIKQLKGLTVDYRTTKSLCRFPLGTAKLLPRDGTPPYNYLWVDSGCTQDTVSRQFAGDHKVIIKDNVGCVDTLIVKIVDVDGPSINKIAQLPSSCFHTNDGKILLQANGGFTPYSVLVKGNLIVDGKMTNVLCDSLTNILNKPFLINNLKPSNYAITIYDTYGCKGVTSVQSTEPDTISVNKTVISPYCLASSSGMIKLNAKGGTSPFRYSVTYNDAVLGQFVNDSIPDLAVGRYKIEIKDFKDCAITDTFTLTARSKVTADIPKLFQLCGGVPLVLDAKNPGSKREWLQLNTQNTDTVQVKTFTQAGTYLLKLSYSPECTGIDTFELQYSNDLVKSNILVANTAYLGDTLEAIDVSWPKPKTVQWFIPSEFSIVANKSTFEVVTMVPTVTGVFKVGINGSLGFCESEQYKSVTIYPAEDRPSADSTIQNASIQLSITPNPNDGVFSLGVTLTEIQPVSIKVFSSFGMLLATREVTGLSEYSENFDLSQFVSGMYYICVTTSNGIATAKLSIMK